LAANAAADVAAAAAGRAARFSYGVIAKQAALNDQRFKLLDPPYHSPSR
jgi:hypothetical protein